MIQLPKCPADLRRPPRLLFQTLPTVLRDLKTPHLQACLYVIFRFLFRCSFYVFAGRNLSSVGSFGAYTCIITSRQKGPCRDGSETHLPISLRAVPFQFLEMD